MLSASKLYQSVSISGPSATSKPIPTNTSSSESRVWVTRWRCPGNGGAGIVPSTNSVRSMRLSAISRASSTRPISARRCSTSPSIVARAPCRRCPSTLRASGSRPARPREASASADFLPETEAATWRISSVEPAPAIDSRGLGDQGIDVERFGHPATPRWPASIAFRDRPLHRHSGHRRAKRLDLREGRPTASVQRRWLAPRSRRRRPTRRR